MLNSVEILDCDQPKHSRSWSINNIAEMTPRYSPSVGILNESSILIMGGHDGVSNLSDAWIFNSKTRKGVVAVEDGPLSFISRSNTINAEPGIVQALVRDESFVVHMVRFTHRTKKVEVIQTLGAEID
mmetsp:Transcript_1710/g.2374  ORF Transcript_1710/g.2374 Transcript_1710/m.2374 type:complete len:128 (+) Transcript_1710:401-784(+)